MTAKETPASAMPAAAAVAYTAGTAELFWVLPARDSEQGFRVVGLFL